MPSADGVTAFCPFIAFAICFVRDTLLVRGYTPAERNVMPVSEDLVAEIEALGDKLEKARASITRRFIGQERVVDLTLTALLCGGHALLIGLPGLGKTRLVETLSTVMGLHGNRIQFTPDLMPADILLSLIHI